MKTKFPTNPPLNQRLDQIQTFPLQVDETKGNTSSVKTGFEEANMAPVVGTELKPRSQFRFPGSAAIVAVILGTGLFALPPSVLATEIGTQETTTTVNQPTKAEGGTAVDLQTVEPRALLRLLEDVINKPEFVARMGGRSMVQRLYGDLARDVAVAIDNLRDHPRPDVYAGGVLVAGQAVTEEARQRPFVAWKVIPAKTSAERVAQIFAELERVRSTLDEGGLRGAIAGADPFRSGQMPTGESFTLAVKNAGDAVQVGIAISVRDLRRFQDAPIDDATYAARVSAHLAAHLGGL